MALHNVGGTEEGDADILFYRSSQGRAHLTALRLRAPL